MKADSRTTFINEVDTTTELIAQRPFKIERQNKRRFIRLEIAAPMSLRTLKQAEGQLSEENTDHTIQGSILNISAGGVLVDLYETLSEHDVVAMHFTLQETESLDDVLGLVKRTDITAEGCLAGIEFITREQLEDIFSKGELEVLPPRYTHFDESVRTVLNRYLIRTQTDREQSEQ